jgi:predicted metal-dependent hydrolase
MDARLREGIRLFNIGRYFESHEALEEFYLRAEERHKPFLEGLVGLAVACRLFREFGEGAGAIRLARQALIRLEAYQPAYLGIRVKALIEIMEEWTKELEGKTAPAGNEGPRIPLRRFGLF